MKPWDEQNVQRMLDDILTCRVYHLRVDDFTDSVLVVTIKGTSRSVELRGLY